MKLVSFIGLSVTALTLTFSTPSFADNGRRIDVDSKVVTEHKARINGELVTKKCIFLAKIFCLII